MHLGCLQKGSVSETPRGPFGHGSPVCRAKKAPWLLPLRPVVHPPWPASQTPSHKLREPLQPNHGPPHPERSWRTEGLGRCTACIGSTGAAAPRPVSGRRRVNTVSTEGRRMKLQSRGEEKNNPCTHTDPFSSGDEEPGAGGAPSPREHPTPSREPPLPCSPAAQAVCASAACSRSVPARSHPATPKPQKREGKFTCRPHTP